MRALDYTTKKSHRFTVRATVGGEYSDAVVVVNVLDVNNNCPVFSQSQTYTRLTSPVESGTIIAWNKATDLDTTPSLTYQIVAGDSAGMFTSILHFFHYVILCFYNVILMDKFKF